MPSSPPQKTPWTRGEIISVIGLILTVLGIIFALAQPEVRRFIRLDHSPLTQQATILPSATSGNTNPSHKPGSASTSTPVPAGIITEFPLPTTGGSPYHITTGPDGNLWFTERSGKIGRISPRGIITLFSIPTVPDDPIGITTGPDGNLWFTEYEGNKIGRISPDGTITEYPLSIKGGPEGITAGPDGNLWFTYLSINGDKIGRISPSGTITEFPIPIANNRPSPWGITAGPDGNLWFTEGDRNKIGYITSSR